MERQSLDSSSILIKESLGRNDRSDLILQTEVS